MKTTTTICLILVLFSIGTYAQTNTELSSKQTLEVHSSILDEARNISIYFPENYASSENSYPVLYLLDGRNHFQHAIGAVNFLSNRGIIPKMLIVSVHNVDRNRDFSPVHTDRIPSSGGAKKFLGFVSDELTTYLDDNFRTSGFNVLLGHSFGGTFAVYSLLTKPDVFDGYIAISPYLQYAENHLVKRAGEDLKPFKKNQKYIYMTVGDEPDYYTPLEEFSSAIQERTDGTVDLKYVKMASENHATIPYITLFNGLRFIFSDWQLSQVKFQKGLGEIDAHFSHVSSKYGFEVKTPEMIINALGYNRLQGNEAEKAIAVFKENVKRYPGSANVYDSLGEAYESTSQFKLAEKNYQKAVDLGIKQNHVNLSVFKENLERVQQQ